MKIAHSLINAQAASGARPKTGPTKGATNFNFRKNAFRGDFFGLPIKTQGGPFANSYPTADLPATGLYPNTYGK